MPRAGAVTAFLAALLVPGLAGSFAPGQSPSGTPRPAPFGWPCAGYPESLEGPGGFGVLIGKGRPPFSGTRHLGEDVKVAAGTPVVSIADGRVRYSDFSPTWTDGSGATHWNLGNVVVIEHALDPPEDGLTHVCSVSMHLAKDRKVGVGDAVARGQPIGSVGAGGSSENGGYPVHLHFGIHRGPYFQVAPSWLRERMREAAATGLPVDDPRTGAMRLVRGEPEMERLHESAVVFRFPNRQLSVMSLLTGSTAPEPKPADIIHWCHGYGSDDAVREWLRPSEWLRKRVAARKPA